MPVGDASNCMSDRCAALGILHFGFEFQVWLQIERGVKVTLLVDERAEVTVSSCSLRPGPKPGLRNNNVSIGVRWCGTNDDTSVAPYLGTLDG